MENMMPKMIKEMIEYYAEQKLNPIFDTFVKKDVLKS